MIISFGWTTPALLAGRKTVTRRDWASSHAAHFKAGMLVDAWNTSPRNVRGNPHKVATIRLTHDVFRQETRLAPAEDFEREGFAYLDEQGLTVAGVTPLALWNDWHIPEHHTALCVVRFEVVDYLDG